MAKDYVKEIRKDMLKATAGAKAALASGNTSLAVRHAIKSARLARAVYPRVSVPPRTFLSKNDDPKKLPGYTFKANNQTFFVSQAERYGKVPQRSEAEKKSILAAQMSVEKANITRALARADRIEARGTAARVAQGNADAKQFVSSGGIGRLPENAASNTATRDLGRKMQSDFVVVNKTKNAMNVMEMVKRGKLAMSGLRPGQTLNANGTITTDLSAMDMTKRGKLMMRAQSQAPKVFPPKRMTDLQTSKTGNLSDINIERVKGRTIISDSYEGNRLMSMKGAPGRGQIMRAFLEKHKATGSDFEATDVRKLSLLKRLAPGNDRGRILPEVGGGGGRGNQPRVPRGSPAGGQFARK